MAVAKHTENNPGKAPLRGRTASRAPGTTGSTGRSKIVVHGNRGIKVVRSVTVLESASKLYSFFRDPANLTAVIRHPVTITALTEIEYRWVASTNKGREVTWDVIVINDEPDRLIAWRSREGDPVVHAGSIRFEDAPGDEGTEVTVALQYDPPMGRLGAAVAWLNHESASQCIYDALRCLKALREAGEVPTTEGQPRGGDNQKRKARR